MTLSNAMDVGNPSNFERLEEIFRRDWRDMAAEIRGVSIDDRADAGDNPRSRLHRGILVDPHTAVGCAAARSILEASNGPSGQIIVLSTAHPAKFSETVKRATGSAPDLPERLAACLSLPKLATPLGNTFHELSEYMLGTFD